MTELSELLTASGIEFATNFSLSSASSFRIGGKADIAAFPKNENELTKIVSIAKNNQVKFEVIGNGTNVLFSDEGYRGIIIFTKKMNSVIYNENRITAACGASITSIANIAKKHSLSGIEFAHGIPGSVGGAAVMNAGAYGGQMSDIVYSSRAFDTSTSECIFIKQDEHNFGYRKSIYTENKDLICILVNLELTVGDKLKIEDLIHKNSESRRQKQPLELPSCGSYFKRPDGFFAGKLIEDCFLKGVSVGGAQVSSKHAGFIVNTGGATARDVLELEKIIKNTVFDRFGVMLEREVKYIN